MNRTTDVALSYFGKVRSRGDFVRSTQQGPLTQLLDQWLSRGLQRLVANPRWKQLYDQTAPAHFAVLGVRRHVGLAGHLVPSVDASGRRFPFVAAGSFAVAAAQPLMSHAPMVLHGLWSRLAAIGEWACAASDASTVLAEAEGQPISLEAAPNACAASFAGALQTWTVGTVQAQLQRAHPAFDLRRALLGLGLLLQPVPASGVARLERGLRLPLPADMPHASFIGTLWTRLVMPFLARGDFEVTLLMPSGLRCRSPSLVVGFAGAAPTLLQSLFDPERASQALVDVMAPAWVEGPLAQDPALKRLDTYLQQEQLPMSHVVATFEECFLGE